jgi:hypothetical protein
MKLSITAIHDVVAVSAFVGFLGFAIWQIGHFVSVVSTNRVLETADLYSSYRVGDRLPELPAANFNSSPHTLALVVRTGCPYCTASMPFYRDLVTRASASGSGVRIMAFCVDKKETCVAYLADNDIRIDTLSVGSDLQITGTPTLLLIDRTGRIEHVWIGRQGRPGESAIRTAVFSEKGSGIASSLFSSFHLRSQ